MSKLTREAIAVVLHVIETCPEEESQAKTLVAEAKKPGSPLAPYFTWNEQEAAYKYHIQEAHDLLIRVKQTVSIDKSPPVTIRMAIKTSHETPGYATFERVVASPALQESVKERFLHEVGSLCQRYSEYGIPQVNILIRIVCRALKLKAPVLFNGADVQRRGVGVG